MEKLRWAVAVCFVVTLCAPVAASAGSDSKAETQAVRVSYNDLNIHSAAGAKQLYARLKRASESVCGVDSYYVLGSVNRAAASTQCYREALDRAVERIGSDELERLHNS